MSAVAFNPGREMSIVQAAALRERLLAVLAVLAEGPASLALDLSEVDDFDSAGIQLLLATRRTLAEAGGRLVIAGASATVRAHLALFGLDTPT